MSTEIRDAFKKSLPTQVSPSTAKRLVEFCQAYEVKKNHTEVLRDSSLGVSRMYFHASDQAELFDIFGISREEVKKTIRGVGAIDKSFVVISDPYNNFTIWLIHVLQNSSLSQSQIYATQMALLKMMHYKFFTSLVQVFFKHDPDEGIMRATIEGLSRKFNITIHGDWYSVIENQCREILQQDGIYSDVIRRFIPDKKVSRLISDSQTRLRNMIKGVAQEFYAAHEAQIGIGSYGRADTIAGEKLIRSGDDTILNMASGISNSILNYSSFIDYELIGSITDYVGNVTPAMFREFVVYVTETAVWQGRNGKLDLVKETGNSKEYIGIRALVQALLQKTYRNCIEKGVNVKSKKEIFLASKNIYTSSRMSDQGILDVKNGLSKLVESSKVTTRKSTMASLRTCFVLYIIVKSFSYIKK